MASSALALVQRLLCACQQPPCAAPAHTCCTDCADVSKTPHAAEDSLPELNYEGEPLKLSHFLQNGVRRPVLVRDSCQTTPPTPNPVFGLPGSSLGVHIAAGHVSTLIVLAMQVP